MMVVILILLRDIFWQELSLFFEATLEFVHANIIDTKLVCYTWLAYLTGTEGDKSHTWYKILLHSTLLC